MRIVHGGAPFRYLDVAPSLKRGEQHEQAGRAMALIFIVVAGWLAWPHREGRARLGYKLFRCFVEADERPGRIVRPRVDLKHVLHRRNERGVGLGRDYPIFLQVRFEIVFLAPGQLC